MQPKTAVRAATLQTAIPVFKLLKAPLLLPLNEVGEGPAEPEPDTLVPEVAAEVAPVAVFERVTPKGVVEVVAEGLYVIEERKHVSHLFGFRHMNELWRT